MKYFEYPLEIDSEGLRVWDPDHVTQFTPEYMFSKHAWLLGATFSFEIHPDGGLYLKKVVPDEVQD